MAQGAVLSRLLFIACASTASSSNASAATSASSEAKGFLDIPNQPGYAYGPTLVEHESQIYMWFCSPGTSPRPWDYIRLTVSKDGGKTWSSPVIALENDKNSDALDYDSVCDPTVVKLHGVWHMYYTCINTVSPPDGYTNNRVCLATAARPEGPWYKYHAPIVQDEACAVYSTDSPEYCVGQPSAVVVSDVVYLYYTVVINGMTGRNPGVVLAATSSDGVQFTPQTTKDAPSYGQRDVDVKYVSSSKIFVMVQGDVGDSAITWAYSTDGIHFSPYDRERGIQTNPSLPEGGTNNNPGLLGRADGTMTSGMTQVVYGSSYDPPSWGRWHLYRTRLSIDPPACESCVDWSCDAGCQQVIGGDAVGVCNVGTAGHCCDCSQPAPEVDCVECTNGLNCIDACRPLGYSTGICARRASRLDVCCSCLSMVGTGLEMV